MFIYANLITPQGPQLRDVNTLTEAEKNEVYRCPHCKVRVYPHYPRIGHSYFSAGGTPHTKGCAQFHEALFSRSNHIDHTGQNVNLEDFLRDFRHIDRRHPVPGGEPEDDVDLPAVEDEDNAQALPTRRVEDRPRTLMQLYSILEDPDVYEYAGQLKSHLIIDRRTIFFHRKNRLDHIALAVTKRVYPPEELKSKLRADGLWKSSIVMQDAYPPFAGSKKIYYILSYRNGRECKEAFQILAKKRDKFLALADWKHYASTSSAEVYLGKMYVSGTLHALLPRCDCDE